MLNFQTKDLFQLQAELIDMKIDNAVSQKQDHIITHLSNVLHNEIQDVKNEMNAFFSSVNSRFISLDTRIESLDTRLSSIEHRLIAVETKLGIKNITHSEIRTRLLDYTFKATSAIVGGAVVYVTLLIHALIK